MTLLALYLADDATAVTDLPTDAEAGQDSSAVALHLWNHKDDPDGQAAVNLITALRTESPSQPATWLAKGVPPQDELWWRLRVTGFDNRGDSGWSIDPTDWRSVGAFSALAIDRIPPDCAVYLEAQVRPPSTADPTSWRSKLVFFHNEFAQPLPPALALAGRGVVAGAGLAEHSALVAGGDVAVSDPPDHRVHTAAGLWIYRGVLHGKVAQEHPFDLTDGDGAALLDGESFWAALTLGPGSVTLTKGSKSITPQRPILPLWEPFLAWVRVEHDPSGIPQIDAADLDGKRLLGRFHLEPGDGLDATLHAGQAIGAATWCYRAHSTPLVFATGAESYVWLLATGKPLVTTSPEPPEPDAMLLWEVETDTTSIVSVVDRRVFVTPAHVVTLAGELPAIPGVIDRLTLAVDRLFLERVVVDVPDLGGGTAGETVFEVLRNGSTLYPSSAEDDQRPRFAFDAAELAHAHGVPEIRELRRGDEITFATAVHATGGAPPRARLQLFGWNV